MQNTYFGNKKKDIDTIHLFPMEVYRYFCFCKRLSIFFILSSQYNITKNLKLANVHQESINWVIKMICWTVWIALYIHQFAWYPYLYRKSPLSQVLGRSLRRFLFSIKVHVSWLICKSPLIGIWMEGIDFISSPWY